MDTRDHVLETLDWLSQNPFSCKHLEMETYTWEVLPSSMQSTEVVDQIAKEYIKYKPIYNTSMNDFVAANHERRLKFYYKNYIGIYLLKQIFKSV